MGKRTTPSRPVREEIFLFTRSLLHVPEEMNATGHRRRMTTAQNYKLNAHKSSESTGIPRARRKKNCAPGRGAKSIKL